MSAEERAGLTCAEFVELVTDYLEGALDPETEGRFVLQVFATQAFEGEIVIAADEITDHRWVRLDDVGLMHTTPDLQEVVAGAFRIFDRS